jgi:hypothetical protein
MKEADPHPTLRDLLTKVSCVLLHISFLKVVLLTPPTSHELHKFYLNLHVHAREYRRELKEINQKRAAKHLELHVPVEKPEMDNFQDPQVGRAAFAWYM